MFLASLGMHVHLHFCPFSLLKSKNCPKNEYYIHVSKETIEFLVE
uniref:Uncharacterized protein n=1 Tax=Rhizophora mucronata TaxID=61149 RepID=A0A2P2NWE3_RHIMU